MSATTFRAFSNGSDYSDWKFDNYDRCVLDAALAEQAKPAECPLAAALIKGYCTDGTIPVVLGVEYGAVQSERFPECYRLPYDCPKREDIP